MGRISPFLAFGGGGSYTPAGGPAFGAEIQRAIETDNTSASVLTVASTMAAGSRAILAVQWSSATQTVSSVTDSASNTWSLLGSFTGGNNTICGIYSAHLTTGLTSGVGTVSINWGTPSFTFRGWGLFTVTGAASAGQPDVASAGASGTSTSPGDTASTVTAATLAFGVLEMDQAATYGSSAWTVIGAAQDWGGGAERTYFYYKVLASAGSQNPAGTLSSSTRWSTGWVALK